MKQLIKITYLPICYPSNCGIYKNDIVQKRNPTTWLIARGVSSVAEIMWLKKHDIENYNLLGHKACSLSSRDAW